MFERLQVKLFVADPQAVDLDKTIPVFHRWIRENVLNELMIDVADYRHVHAGPSIALIGHQSDYFLDEGDERLGLMVFRKRGLEGDAQARLLDGCRRLFRAAQQLEQEPELEGKLRFRTDEVLFRIPDRLHAPADATALEPLRSALEALASRLCPRSDAALQPGIVPKRPLAATLRFKEDLPLRALVY